jgi:hypothetical protein
VVSLLRVSIKQDVRVLFQRDGLPCVN